MRSGRIDGLKAAAIVGVLLLHSLPSSVLTRGSGWWVAQAVPVFVLLLGYNSSRTYRRAGYWERRFRRIYVPFLCVFAVSMAIQPSALRLHGLVTGVLPTDGPGNYFVTLLFQFVLALPALVWVHRRHPNLFLAACLTVSFVWEFLPLEAYVYQAALPKWIAFIALGMALGAALPRWWRLAVAGSAVYLTVITVNPDFPFGPEGWAQSGETVLGAFYTLGLVKLAIARMPALLTTLGQASYHVFLVQIMYFWLVRERGLGWMALAIVACCAGGLAFWAADRAIRSTLANRVHLPEPLTEAVATSDP